MSAVAMIADLRRVGIHLSSNGDRLHIEAPKGKLTPELKRVLSERKPELLAALKNDPIAPQRAALERIAAAEEIDQQLVRNLPDSEVEDCRDLPANALGSYVRALRDSDMRLRGEVPPDETAVAMCRLCGPVWVHPNVATSAPMVDGWPQVLGCPWCHVRRVGGHIPRPPVPANVKHESAQLEDDHGQGRPYMSGSR
jgi:hypothetical protein